VSLWPKVAMRSARNERLLDPLVIPRDYYTHSYFHFLSLHIFYSFLISYHNSTNPFL